MKNMYNEIKILIENNQEIAEFAEFGDGISKDFISQREKDLDCTFSPSYKWWLENYGGGNIAGEEVYSIYKSGLEFPCGDIVYMYRKTHNDGVYNYDSNKIMIYDSDIDGDFYFDSSIVDENGEWAVFSGINDERYADNFLEFLKKRIEAFIED